MPKSKAKNRLTKRTWRRLGKIVSPLALVAGLSASPVRAELVKVPQPMREDVAGETRTAAKKDMHRFDFIPLWHSGDKSLKAIEELLKKAKEEGKPYNALIKEGFPLYNPNGLSRTARHELENELNDHIHMLSSEPGLDSEILKDASEDPSIKFNQKMFSLAAEYGLRVKFGEEYTPEEAKRIGDLYHKAVERHKKSGLTIEAISYYAEHLHERNKRMSQIHHVVKEELKNHPSFKGKPIRVLSTLGILHMGLPSIFAVENPSEVWSDDTYSSNLSPRFKKIPDVAARDLEVIRALRKKEPRKKLKGE